VNSWSSVLPFIVLVVRATHVEDKGARTQNSVHSVIPSKIFGAHFTSEKRGWISFPRKNMQKFAK
jgi:hypothetical protein